MKMATKIVPIKKYYKCFWCEHEFEKLVIYDAEDKFSTRVVCPNCAHLIPTWKKELTGELVGRKHWHPDRK